MDDNEKISKEFKIRTNIADLFAQSRQNKSYLKICAPMVRYSKLEFRSLVRKYGVDLCFTPMIMADSFCRSEKARQNEFTTNCNDSPVIAQFAAQNNCDYLSATEMIYPYVDGVDLNCGCPQRWAVSTGYGCALLSNPEILKDITSTIRRNFPSNFSVSVKIRIQEPLDITINLVRQLEKCGITFVTVHGRTPTQKIGVPSNIDYLEEIKQSISIPMVANGDVKSLTDADTLYHRTNCDGVMSARGILSNPTLFAGTKQTPLSCIQNWIDIDANSNVTFQCFHHHLTFMMEHIMQRKERVRFNQFSKKDEIYEFLDDNYGIKPRLNCDGELMNCYYDESNFLLRLKENVIDESVTNYCSDNSKGKYFDSMTEKDDEDCVLGFMNCNIFDA